MFIDMFSISWSYEWKETLGIDIGCQLLTLYYIWINITYIAIETTYASIATVTPFLFIQVT